MVITWHVTVLIRASNRLTRLNGFFQEITYILFCPQIFKILRRYTAPLAIRLYQQRCYKEENYKVAVKVLSVYDDGTQRSNDSTKLSKLHSESVVESQEILHQQLIDI